PRRGLWRGPKHRMRGRRVLERRARIFLGCEGESEQGYGALLQRLVNASGAKIHVVPVNLQPAGDPLALARKAERKLAEEILRGGPFAAQAVMLDTDRLPELPDGGREARAILARNEIIAIWQRPDFEGLLLRHFAGHEHDHPPRGRSMAALSAVWTDYHKNMSAAELQRRIGLDHVLRAAGVEPDLAELLERLKLIAP
ncbi:hypothetical protein, partial [Rhodobacter sp. NSM]|uniref:hypothetical protein n=1 Tax=Rhodobacter sp. NSM TaxID=3457501 RepID=UPI003FD22FC2